MMTLDEVLTRLDELTGCGAVHPQTEFMVRDGSNTRTYRIRHDFAVQILTRDARLWSTYDLHQATLDDAYRDVLRRVELDLAIFEASHREKEKIPDDAADVAADGFEVWWIQEGERMYRGCFRELYNTMTVKQVARHAWFAGRLELQQRN